MGSARNSTCHCGSGKKYKKCCLHSDERLNSLRLTRNNNENIIAMEMGYEDGDLDNFEYDMTTPEFQAMESWNKEYLESIDKDHPFCEYLLDHSLSPQILLTLAKENTWLDYTEKAEVLLNKWNESLKEEIKNYFEEQEFM